MSCETVRKSLSTWIDGMIPARESEMMQRHIAMCRECAQLHEEVSSMRGILRALPAIPVPARVSSELAVMASRDRARRARGTGFIAWMRHAGDRLELWSENLMRPMALPFAGGLLSAFMLFGAIVPTFALRTSAITDVPIALYTEPSAEVAAPFGFTDDVTVVELTIDANGQILDYSVPHGKMTRELENNIGNMLLFSSFTPATWFGQPTTGKLMISFRRGVYTVRG